MSESQTLYRKYRPQSFDEVAGQTAVIHILRSALKTGKLSHAYLFSGPRGTGKTTSARLLAKALNCLKVTAPTPDPCGECKSCIAIRDGNSMDVIEMDAASHRGIDDIRELRESVRFPPVLSRKKVYIIDESHMLTKEACNALLKTLEEPPDYIVFIFATTDPNKMPGTVLSRCQRYDFNRLSADELTPYLKRIAKTEGFMVEDEKVYDLIYIYSEGAARDAVGLLEQLALLDNNRISEKTVAELLGVPQKESFFDLLEAVARRDFKTTLELAKAACERGASFWNFVNILTAILRDLLAVKQGIRPVDPYRDEEIARLKSVSEAFSYEALFALFQRLGQFRYVFKWETEGRLLWDIAFLELFQTVPGQPAGEDNNAPLRASAAPSTKTAAPSVTAAPPAVASAIATSPQAASPTFAPAPTVSKLAPSPLAAPPALAPAPTGSKAAPTPTPRAQSAPPKPAQTPDPPQAKPPVALKEEPARIPNSNFQYQALLESLATSNPSIAALLCRGAAEVPTEDGVLTIGFPEHFAIPLRFLRGVETMKEIEARASEVAGRPLKVKWAEIKPGKGNGAQSGDGGADSIELQIQQVLEMFPGSRKVN